MKDKKFSIIICGYNEEKNLDGCINSCLNLDYPKNKYEIIYVDNNSKDKSVKVAKHYPIKILVESKQGLSEARNLGIKNSIGEIIVFLDADTKLDKDYLKNHEKTFAKKEVGAGGGKVLPLKETWISNYLGVSLFESYPRYKKFKFVRTYPGCNLTIRRSVLNEVGYFQENLKTSKGITRFSEDKEICERIRKENYIILYNPESVVYHKNTYSIKKLLKIFFNGAQGRLNMIQSGKKDPFSLLFKYNLPIMLLLIFLISIFSFPILSIILLAVSILMLLFLAIKSYYETSMFFQSFFIKPWMDILSLILINCGVIFYRFNSNKR